jgi:hypothetical protein
MEHREPSLRGHSAGEDRGGRAHDAEVILCDICGMALLSHSLPRCDGNALGAPNGQPRFIFDSGGGGASPSF